MLLLPLLSHDCNHHTCCSLIARDRCLRPKQVTRTSIAIASCRVREKNRSVTCVWTRHTPLCIRAVPWKQCRGRCPLLLAAHAFGGTWLCSIYVMRHGGCTLKQANRAGWKGRKERLKNVLSHTPLPTCHSSNFGQMKI